LTCKLAGGDDGACAAIGAGAAVAVGAVTYVALRHLADRDAAARDHQYEPSHGTRPYIDTVTVTPESASQGAEVVLSSRWTALAADPEQELAYTERWEIRKVEGETSRKIHEETGTVEQGSYQKDLRFPIPPSLPQGNYRATYQLAVGDYAVSDAVGFAVVKTTGRGGTGSVIGVARLD
jgi:hypothetical protein